MAGNRFTKVVPCLECGRRAVRTREGLETDEYRCVAGHEFLIEWARSPEPTGPLWPPKSSKPRRERGDA